MGEEIGKTTRDGARRYGIPPDIPLHAVGVDFAAALVGTNMLRPGRSCERAGSSGGINLCWGKPVHDDRLLCYEHFVQKTWNVAGITSTYGKAIEWAEKILDADSFQQERLHREQPGIIFLPYLKGERTPLWNPYAKGLFFGLEQKHDAVDLLIAVHTGIALSIRECIGIIESHNCKFQHPVVTTGGLTWDEWFMQLKADVTGKTFSRMQLFDAELLGIAIVLASSLGHYTSLSAAASEILREEKRFTPQKGMSAMYDKLFKQYSHIRTAVTPYF
jgi:xylulokinase